MICSTLVTKLGYYTPFLYLAPIIASTGAGLLSTMKVNSGSPIWIGFQALYGIGLGCGATLSIVAAQSALPPEDISTGTAIVTFTQTLGAAVFNFVAQNVFQNQVLAGLAQSAPGISAEKLTKAGPTMLREVVPADTLPAVLEVYNTAITKAFYVSVGSAALAIFGVIPLQWLSVKKRKIQAVAGHA